MGDEIFLRMVLTARDVLDTERAAGREPDPRSWHAVDVAERFIRGEATGDELAAAERSAQDAYNAASAARAAAGVVGAAVRAAAEFKKHLE